jgi:hypothetical protein
MILGIQTEILSKRAKNSNLWLLICAGQSLQLAQYYEPNMEAALPEPTDFDLRSQLRGIGIVNISEQDRIVDAARKCSKTGFVLGASWMLLGAPAAAPGALAGFLSGFVTGTATCMGLSYGLRSALKDLGSGELPAP